MDIQKLDLNDSMQFTVRDLKFNRDAKIYDTCPGVFQNLDQGPDGALKTFFFNIVITLEWMSLETRNFF